MSGTRKILHVDMDAFYASVEQRDDPRLRGRPVVVGGPPQSRGVVAAASYEARRFGIHSAMASAQAYRLCRDAVFVTPHFSRYSEVSRQIHEIFARYTDLIEPLSLDEAYLDVTQNRRDLPYATTVAKEIRAAIFAETELTASAGVAPNKFLAKVASDHNKPNGLCVVTPDRVEEFLRDLPVRKVPGVGPVTAERLERLGVKLVPDLLRVDAMELHRHFGRWASSLRDLAQGIDPRAVESDRERKSVSIEDTFEHDVASRDEARRRITALAEGLEDRLRRSGFRGRTVTLKVKYFDFRQITRSRTHREAITSRSDLLDTALRLIDETEIGAVPIRLLGLGVSHGDDGVPRQMRLPFEDSSSS